MPELAWSVTIQIAGGASTATAAPTSPVDAVDRVEVDIDDGAADRVVELQPGSSARVRLLHVRASKYGKELTFKASDGANDSDVVTLTEPALFTAGSIALLKHDPKTLKVSNGTGEAVRVEVLVARNALP